MKAYQTITVETLLTMQQDAALLILDCREIKDYRESHIENALHVHKNLRDSLIKSGDKNRKIVIYCYYGHASEHLSEMFADFGFKQIFNLAGGYASWKEYQKQLVA